jgi:predicted solute-binding protein
MKIQTGKVFNACLSFLKVLFFVFAIFVCMQVFEFVKNQRQEVLKNRQEVIENRQEVIENRQEVIENQEEILGLREEIFKNRQMLQQILEEIRSEK